MKTRKKSEKFKAEELFQESSKIAIELINVSKKYQIHHEKPTLVEKFVRVRNETFWALKNVSLTIKKGERVGIMGPNGSGKTTLLKVISRITTPTTGQLHTYGKVVSLIDLEAGFNLDLTGIQNIYLNGLLLGMKTVEINQQLQNIINFADIKQFIDAPIFTYSEGMKLRLGFSIAIHSNPDTLILDEGITAGDINFQNKSKRKIKELFLQNKTVVVVSHWKEFLEETCEKIILLDNGVVCAMGGLELISKVKK